jgi:HAD superfamily hydrolase (TIGR01509 family)
MGHNPTGTLHGPDKGGTLSPGHDAIRVVLFDYGHTLVDFRRVPAALVRAYEDIRALLERHVSHELPRAEELAHQVTGAMDVLVHESYVQGRLQELDMIQLLEDAFAGIGIELPPDLAQELVVIDHRAFTESITLPDGTLDVLQTLADRGLRMGLVSNITLLPDLLRVDLEALGLARFLSAMAFSSEVGWRKPDHRIFQWVLDRLDASPAEAVFVGDRLRDDIAGARAVGMRTVLTRQFRDELAGPERAEALRIRPEELDGLVPDRDIPTLGDLPDLLGDWGS